MHSTVRNFTSYAFDDYTPMLNDYGAIIAFSDYPVTPLQLSKIVRVSCEMIDFGSHTVGFFMSKVW